MGPLAQHSRPRQAHTTIHFQDKQHVDAFQD